MTDLKPEDLVKLREIAEKATPGPWEHDPEWIQYPDMLRPSMNVYSRASGPDGRIICNADIWKHEPAGAHENAEFIAAFDPPTVLSLLADRARMEKALEEARKVITVVRRNIMVEVIGGNERFQGVPEILAEDIANITTALGASQ